MCVGDDRETDEQVKLRTKLESPTLETGVAMPDCSFEIMPIITGCQ